jgi:hypothetical protein
MLFEFFVKVATENGRVDVNSLFHFL